MLKKAKFFRESVFTDYTWWPLNCLTFQKFLKLWGFYPNKKRFNLVLQKIPVELLAERGYCVNKYQIIVCTMIICIQTMIICVQVKHKFEFVKRYLCYVTSILQNQCLMQPSQQTITPLVWLRGWRKLLVTKFRESIRIFWILHLKIFLLAYKV